ncbi:hypothetical protein KUCAC02_032845, partial [Chaenocephalus aceratus]
LPSYRTAPSWRLLGEFTAEPLIKKTERPRCFKHMGPFPAWDSELVIERKFGGKKTPFNDGFE